MNANTCQRTILDSIAIESAYRHLAETQTVRPPVTERLFASLARQESSTGIHVSMDTCDV